MTETLIAPRARRAGLGRRVADIVSFDDLSQPVADAFVDGPSVVPLDVVPFPMLVLDGDGHALMVNRPWTDLSGLPAGGSLGRSWLQAVDPSWRESLRTDLADGRPGGEAEVNGQRVRWVRAAESAAGQDLVGLGLFPIEAADAPAPLAVQPAAPTPVAVQPAAPTPVAQPAAPTPVAQPAASSPRPASARHRPPDPLLAELALAMTEVNSLLDALDGSGLLRRAPAGR